MINRKLPPTVQKVSVLSVPSIEPVDHLFSAPIFAFQDESEELIKIEITFPAGTGKEKKSLLASATAAMVTEGAGDYSSDQISEIKDFYGAKIQTGVGKDNATVSLLSLASKLESIFPVFAAVVQSPNFPEKEFEAYKARAKASLEVNLDRVELQARLLFSEMFFGKSKYAENYSPDDFDQLLISDLEEFHRNNYSLADSKIFISGNRVSYAIDLLKKYLTQGEKKHFRSIEKPSKRTLGINYRPKEDALQSAIRLGIPALTRNSADYPAFSLTNTIFGGYFGSRLMQNIREDKGFTYGIGSSINHLDDLSYLIVATQVGTEHTDATLNEIREEIKKLQNERLDDAELQLVQNYVAGSLLRNMDGTFNQAALIRMMAMNNLDQGYYDRFLNRIYSVTSDQIIEVARNYFSFDEFTGAIVGKGYADNDS
ncbi:MAG: pitrilysin family protein [Bacteroidota bacterium]